MHKKNTFLVNFRIVFLSDLNLRKLKGALKGAKRKQTVKTTHDRPIRCFSEANLISPMLVPESNHAAESLEDTTAEKD